MSYQKNDSLIFISQLDLQRMFQRAFKRSGIAVTYSQGFNPHPKMTYSPPLPLFVSSACEFIEFGADDDMDPGEIKKRLSANLPDSAVVNEVTKIDEGGGSLSSEFKWAEYEMLFSGVDCDKALNLKSEYETAELISVKKNKKNKEVVKNLKENAKDFNACEEKNTVRITVLLSVENDTVVNPQTFAALLIRELPGLASAKTEGIRKLRVLGGPQNKNVYKRASL